MSSDTDALKNETRRIYKQVRANCYDASAAEYWKYGEKNIKLAKRWRRGNGQRKGYECFVADVGYCPDFNWTLARRDEKKNFSKANCYWRPMLVPTLNKLHPIYALFLKKKATLEAVTNSRGKNASHVMKLMRKHDLDLAQAIHHEDSILGIDPGTKTYTVTWIKGGRVMASFHVPEAIDEMPDTDKHAVFMGFLHRLFSVTRPKLVIAEAFLERGRFATGLSARINYMHGLLSAMCEKNNTAIKIINPSQWKVIFKRIGDLKVLYKVAKKKYKLAPHNVDSMYMARFGYNGMASHANDRAWIEENLPRCAEPFSVWECDILPENQVRVNKYGHISPRDEK